MLQIDILGEVNPIVGRPGFFSENINLTTFMHPEFDQLRQVQLTMPLPTMSKGRDFRLVFFRGDRIMSESDSTRFRA